MSIKTFLSLLLVSLQWQAMGQTQLSGIVLDKTTQQPIEYANIGIAGKNIGTVCNAHGKFELELPNDRLHDYLIVYHLGYEMAKLKIEDLLTNPLLITIELKPSPVVLEEITISDTRPVKLGHRPNDRSVKGFFNASGLGLEGGTLVKNKGTLLLTSFHFHILKIPFDSLKFRLNFYTENKKEPAQSINAKDIIFTVTQADTGHFSLSLMEEKIQVTGNFVCTIELVGVFGQAPRSAMFIFSAVPDRKGLVYKKPVSFGQWEKIKKYSLCFWFTGIN